MYELFDTEKTYILPSGVTKNGSELASSDNYKMLSLTPCAVNLVGNIFSSYVPLDILKEEYGVNADDPNTAITKVNQAVKKQTEQKISGPEQMNAMLSLASIMIPTVSPTVKDSVVVSLAPLFPEWATNRSYKKGETITYNDKYYRVSQDHTSQDTWHPGDEGTESLYYEIVIAPDGIIVWKQPSGEYDAPDAGDLRHYPDADGDIYKSLIDNNAYSPDAYPAGWEKQTVEE